MASFSIETAFKDGWAVTKKYWYMAAGYFILLEIINAIVRFLGRNSTGLMFISEVIGIAISLYFSALLLEASLRAMRGEEMTFGTFLRNMPAAKMTNYFIASILTGIAVVFGLILLIIPGVFLLLAYGQVKYLVIDKDMEAIPAMKESMQMMKGNKAMYLGFILISAVAAVLSFILFLVPALFVIPLVFFAQASVYMQLMGEKVVLPAVPAAV